MLAGSCFRNDTAFSHAASQEGLAQSVVDLMGSRMTEVLSLQIDPEAHMLGKSTGVKKRGRAPCKKVQKFLELSLELLIGAGFPIRLLQLFQRGHERFRNEYAPVVAKMARI
jgi:hypothetical protein